MHFAFTDEQNLIREAAQAFFAEHGASARVRSAMASAPGYDADTWRAMAQEMGWAGIALPEDVGGAGLGALELALLQQEAGRCLVPSPFFATVCLAAPAIQLAGNEAQRSELLPAIASGERTATLACSDERGLPGAAGVSVELRQGPQGLSLSGLASYVINGHTADLMIVAARAPGSAGAAGVSLVALPANTPGVSIERLVMLDQTRPMARVRFNTVSVAAEQILGAPGAAGPALATTLQRAQVALAAEQTGGAEATLEITTNYAKQRVQFGRVIGSFQAVKHTLADMMVQVEAAKSAVYYAACVVDQAPDELPEAAALAKAYCSDAYMACAGHMIQLHGGIGFTWEHDAHLFFKRARASATLLGTPQQHRERLAQLIGLDDAPRAAAG